MVRNTKRSIFPLLMRIFLKKLVKRKGYMPRMKYTKFRKKITFQKHVIPFLKWPLLTPTFINAHLLDPALNKRNYGTPASLIMFINNHDLLEMQGVSKLCPLPIPGSRSGWTMCKIVYYPVKHHVAVLECLLKWCLATVFKAPKV